MTFVGAVKSVFTRWNDYKGISSRGEYWYFTLFTFLVLLVVSTIESVANGGQATANIVSLQNLVQLVLYFWVIPLTIRRFHDAGFSGYWLLTGLIPWIFIALSGPAILLFKETLDVYMTLKDPTEEQTIMLAERFVSAFGLTFLAVIPVVIFQFVVTVLKSKPSWRGNRFAPATEAPKDGWA
ncbi:MAG: hypothetical protein RLZ28_465 [Actinomycetota bacterium]